MKKFIFGKFTVITVAILMVTSLALAGGNYSRIKTWSSSETLTASDLNAEHNNHINNATPTGLDDHSSTTGQMDTTSDPYPGSVQTQATSTAGELEQLRFQIKAILGEADWYIDTDGSMASVFTNAATFAGKKTFSNNVILSKGADVASATALPVITDGNYFDITGTTTVTSIDTVGVGAVIKLHFDAALTLTHDATDLILPTGVNITTAAGDEAEFVEYATGDWRCVNYQRASGQGFDHVSSNWPSFSVHKNGSNQTGIVTATPTDVTWSTEEFDTNSDFTSNAFTPTVAGKYLLTAGLEFTVSSDTAFVKISLYKNGAEYKTVVNQSAGAAADGVTISVVVDANGVDDDYKVVAEQTTGSDKIIDGTSTKTFFTGARIG